MKGSEKSYKRIVIKIGSSILCSQGARCDADRFLEIARQIGQLVCVQAKEVVVVSSGAIALGMGLMQLKSRPRDLPLLQAAAALGQNVLMDNYSLAFQECGRELKFRTLHCAQVLLTWEDFNDRTRYLNAKNTLSALLKLGAIPVVNENDTISTEEIRFGDNDRLSALVGTLVNADLLIILSDVDGLLDRDKRLVRVVTEINQQIKRLASPTDKSSSVGGMVTKIEAAKISVDSGIPCVIANGATRGIITSIINDPGSQGTLFTPSAGLTERERWIAFGTKTKGRIVIDDGARAALINKKSLLSVGVSAVSGSFEAGDIVSVEDSGGCECARGKVGIGSRQLDKIKGSRFDKEVIHRDNIVILSVR